MNTIKFSEGQLLMNLVSQDNALAEQSASRLVHVLGDYLVVTLSADKTVARECVERGLDILRERIVHKTVEPGRKALKELLVLVQNQFFEELRKVDRDGSAVFSEMLVNEPEVQINLVSTLDTPENLDFCLNTLDSRSRDLLQYIFSFPIPSQLKVSQKFGISPTVIRSRRSSIIERLSECFVRNSV
jgi:hypothetical protein